MANTTPSKRLESIRTISSGVSGELRSKAGTSKMSVGGMPTISTPLFPSTKRYLFANRRAPPVPCSTTPVSRSRAPSGKAATIGRLDPQLTSATNVAAPSFIISRSTVVSSSSCRMRTNVPSTVTNSPSTSGYERSDMDIFLGGGIATVPKRFTAFARSWMLPSSCRSISPATAIRSP